MAESLIAKIISGAAVGLVREIFTSIYRAQTSQTKNATRLVQSLDSTETKNSIKALTEAEKISNRFKSILDLMNEGRNYQLYTISKLAQILDMEKVGDLEDIFLGKTESTFNFMKKFCEEFGVSYPWLTDGEGAPFDNKDNTMYSPSYETFKKIIPERIYFIRAKPLGEAFAILQIKDWKYLTIYRSWPIHSGTGQGGQSQIFDFYKLILKLEQNGFSSRLRGLHLDEEDFRLLHQGSIFPGKLLDGAVDDGWYIHFTDIDHRYWTTENYKQKYDKNFIGAQRVIQSELNRDLSFK